MPFLKVGDEFEGGRRVPRLLARMLVRPFQIINCPVQKTSVG